MVGLSFCVGIYADSRDITDLKLEGYERVALSDRQGREKEAAQCVRLSVRRLVEPQAFISGMSWPQIWPQTTVISTLLWGRAAIFSSSLFSPPLFISSSPAQFSIILLLLHSILAAAARLALIPPTPPLAHLYSFPRSSFLSSICPSDCLTHEELAPTAPPLLKSLPGRSVWVDSSVLARASEWDVYFYSSEERKKKPLHGRLYEVLLEGRWMYVNIYCHQERTATFQIISTHNHSWASQTLSFQFGKTFSYCLLIAQ